ncbi:MAG: DUF4407 domain-containing protein [Chitinophagaceae bacterium]
MQSTNTPNAPEKVAAFTRFLWWLATAEPQILKNCLVDRNRYAIIGTTVLGTWLFATLAWTYFFGITSNNWVAAIPLGLLMGGIILSIDRALIKGIQSGKKRILPFVFRGLLAFTIGSFMAQPALLYLFDKEIQTQIAIDNEAKKKQKLQLQTAFYAAEKNNWTQLKNKLQKQLADKYQEVAVARNGFIAEVDGTGGSGKVGLKTIALTKKNAFEELNNQYQLLQSQIQPQIKVADSALLAVENKIQTEQTQFNQLLNNGFLTRIEALANLTQNHSAVQIRYYLILAILLLIELMPLIAKYLVPEGSYDLSVQLQEENEKQLATNNMQRILAEKTAFNELTHHLNLQNITEFSNITNQKSSNWLKANQNSVEQSTNNELWAKFSKDILNNKAW